MQRRIALFAPAAEIEATRTAVLSVAPDFAGLLAPIAPNSTSFEATHFAGEGTGPVTQIAALNGVLGLTYGYIDEGPEGEVFYVSFDEFIGAFNYVRWQDPNNSPT